MTIPDGALLILFILHGLWTGVKVDTFVPLAIGMSTLDLRNAVGLMCMWFVAAILYTEYTTGLPSHYVMATESLTELHRWKLFAVAVASLGARAWLR